MFKPSFFRQPENLLLMMAFVMPLTFSVWNALLNNFVIERAAFTGKEIGMLQSLREVPGFLAFTAVFILLFIREQRFATLSLLIMSIGVMITGFFPSVLGLYLTTVLMSTGFHYFETINQSLTLQWLPKEKTAEFLGKSLAVKSVASLGAYGGIWLLMSYFEIGYEWMYFIAGGLGLTITLFIMKQFPLFPQQHEQHKTMVVRKRYWLFYLLTFFSGARRQIFMVFAGFMMVEKFGYSVGEISFLYAINYVFNLFFGMKIGSFITKIGDKNALIIEYVALIIIFTSYAYVSNPQAAAALYILDHIFFGFSMAIKTYFQKIADPKDIAASAGVSFSINHIAAVFIPALLGILWIESPKQVFFAGTGFAVVSLLLAFNIPTHPNQHNRVRFGEVTTPQ